MPENILSNFMLSLELMWKGMLGIFAVVIIIAAIIYFLGKIPSKKEQKTEE